MHNDAYASLRRLSSACCRPDDAVLSLYLDLSDEMLETALAFAHEECSQLLDLQHAPAHATLAGPIADLLAELPFLCEEATEQGYRGLAVFLATSPPLDERVLARVALQNQAVLARRPALRQLLTLHEEYERTVVVSVRGSTADAPQIELADVRMGDVEHSRYLAPERGSALAALDPTLRSMLRDDPRLHLVIAAAPERHAPLRALLGAEVRAAIIDWLERDTPASDPATLRLVHQALQRFERQEEARAVARLLDAHPTGHATAIGLEQTLLALHERRVETLLVLQSHTAAGWRCDACDRLGATPVAPVCTSCGATVTAVALEEHLLEVATASGARLETVLESEPLARVGGIGALLLGEGAPRSREAA